MIWRRSRLLPTRSGIFNIVWKELPWRVLVDLRPPVRKNLITSQMKAKKSSSRYAKSAGKHGDNVFELEAVPPERLQKILGEAIDRVLDADKFNAEIKAGKREATYLEGVHRSLTKMIRDFVSACRRMCAWTQEAKETQNLAPKGERRRESTIA